MNENVNHPKHYNAGKFEVIDVIEDWKLGFNLGNAIKYIGRAEYKGKKEEDLKKAIWYIERELGKNEKVKKDELPNYEADFNIDDEQKDFDNYKHFLSSELGKVVENAMNKSST